jgi:hypothetical protein
MVLAARAARMGDVGLTPTRARAASSLGPPHDLIDPNQPDEKVDLVYPVLIGLIEQYR